MSDMVVSKVSPVEASFKVNVAPARGTFPPKRYTRPLIFDFNRPKSPAKYPTVVTLDFRSHVCEPS